MYQQLEIASANLKILKHDVGTPWHFNLADNFLSGDMFKLEHFKYDTKSKGLNKAPSMTEIMQAAQKAEFYIEQSLTYCNDSVEQIRLLEDKSRVDYGYNMYMYMYMYMYIYHMVRTSMFHKKNNVILAKQEFLRVKEYADKIRNVTDLVHASYSDDSNAKNGFIAAHSMKQYYSFEKLYGQTEK